MLASRLPDFEQHKIFRRKHVSIPYGRDETQIKSTYLSICSGTKKSKVAIFGFAGLTRESLSNQENIDLGKRTALLFIDSLKKSAER
jgi:hypothetical protein